MKIIFPALFALIATTTIAHANRAVFLEIAEVASLANGSAEVKNYDNTLTKAAVQELGKKELATESNTNCGPWKVITGRREAFKIIGELESMVEQTNVLEKLQGLYNNNEIFAVVGAISNNEIECTLSYFNVYGADGSMLELRYDLGD